MFFYIVEVFIDIPTGNFTEFIPVMAVDVDGAESRAWGIAIGKYPEASQTFSHVVGTYYQKDAPPFIVHWAWD